MHIIRDNQFVSTLDNLNEECTATKACSRAVRAENGAAPLDISQNSLRSDGGIEPIAEKGILYGRANANNVKSTKYVHNGGKLVNIACRPFPACLALELLSQILGPIITVTRGIILFLQHT